VKWIYFNSFLIFDPPFYSRVSARLGEVNLDSDCDDVAEQDFLQSDINSVFGDLLGRQISNKNGANSCAADPLNVPIEEVVVHPGYKYDLVEGFPNDLALVRLAKSVQPSQYVRPICLKGLARNLTPKEEKEGMLTVAGWGMTDMHGSLIFWPQKIIFILTVKDNFRWTEK
jgi:Trypsin